MIEKTEAQKRTESLLLAGLKSRRAKEKRFVWLGRGAIAIALFFLATLFILLAQRVFQVFPILCHAGSIAGSRPA